MIFIRILGRNYKNVIQKIQNLNRFYDTKQITQYTKFASKLMAKFFEDKKSTKQVIPFTVLNNHQ